MKVPVFKLFANCIPVKGARRGLLCDLQTGRMKLIPNSLHEVLTRYKDRPTEEIKTAYESRYDEIIDEYFQFLVEEGWGVWCDQPELFPDLDLSYETPELITNAVIDADAGSNHDYVSIIDQLEDLGCKHILFRFYDPVPLEAIEKAAAATEGRRLRGIELQAPYGPDFEDEERVSEWCRRFPRIISLSVTGAPAFRRIQTSDEAKTMGLLFYHPDVVDSHQCCGVIDKMYFTVNITAFTEATNYNSCLNRKISLDVRGHIKNCPSMDASYGDISKTTLREALFQPGFQEIWSVTKDQVAICKDCEFRYVCTDCRAFTEDSDARYAKPAKCGYDPYTATWGETRSASFPV